VKYIQHFHQYLIPLVRGLQYTLKSVVTKTITGTELNKIVIDVISRRLGILVCNKIVAKLTFLDPRFKKQVLGYLKIRIIRKNSLLRNSYILNNKQQEDTSSVPIDVESNVLWKQFNTKVTQIRTTPSTGISALLIIRQYLKNPYLNRKQSPLDFWKKYKNTFPELYKLQMKYFRVPATSVPSECVFSKPGQITNDRSNKLHPKILDLNLFLNSNTNIEF